MTAKDIIQKWNSQRIPQLSIDETQELIDEVERLKQIDAHFLAEVENSAKHMTCDRCVKKTAIRCVEIVEHEVAACSNPQTYVRAICEEFGINYPPKAG